MPEQKPTHTPGPWVIEELPSHQTEYGNAITAIYAYADEDGKDGATVAKVNRWAWGDNPATPESNANARLIAAAPDLLEALQKIANLRYGYDGDCGAVAIAEAAIAKAT